MQPRDMKSHDISSKCLDENSAAKIPRPLVLAGAQHRALTQGQHAQHRALTQGQQNSAAKIPRPLVLAGALTPLVLAVQHR